MTDNTSDTSTSASASQASSSASKPESEEDPKVAQLEEGFNTLVSETQDKYKQLDAKIEKTENKIDDSKTQLIETLGIFVALFTFISVEFQILKNFDDFDRGIVLTLALAGIMLLFVFSIDHVVRLSRSELYAYNFKTSLIKFLTRYLLIIIAIALFIVAFYFWQKLPDQAYSPSSNPSPSISSSPTPEATQSSEI